MNKLKKIFPQTRFKFSEQRQVKVILEEVVELSFARTKPHKLYEACDILQATCSYLYNNYTDKEINYMISKMVNKNYKRGYYI